jgi:hypothetical protein
MDKKKEGFLIKHYYDPSFPASYGGVQRFYNAIKIMHYTRNSSQ